MKKQLELIAKSYDKGIDSYDNFPSYITSHPNYPLFEQMRMRHFPIALENVYSFFSLVEMGGNNEARYLVC